MLTSGQLLADRYRLAHRIAVGGMGEVWEAADTRLDRKVAVKVLKPELCGDAEFLHRFRTEARTTASLNHSGIASVHDYGETAAIPDGPKDTAYLVMELVEGEPLAAIIANRGRLSAEITLDILEQAGHALQAAHERGFVHRDVKPGNIMIVPSGHGIKVKLTDFGIAKAADAAPVTRSGMVMGTAHYIAPEQALGQEAEPASDVYSLAVVGYECLAGHRPFLSENAVTVAMMHIRNMPPALPPDVPPGARAIVEATLVKDPRRRYASGGEFAAAVAAVRAGLPLPTPSGMTMVTTHAAGNPAGTHPGTHPGMLPLGARPVAPGMMLFQQPPPRPGSRAWLWVLVVVLVAGLVVLAVLFVPKLVGSGDKMTPGRPTVGDPDRRGDEDSSDKDVTPNFVPGSNSGVSSKLPSEPTEPATGAILPGEFHVRSPQGAAERAMSFFARDVTAVTLVPPQSIGSAVTIEVGPLVESASG
jgi:eukaryotic-like serine/threonine-protein kinase